MRVSSVNIVPSNYNCYRQNFKGAKEEVISDGLKEFVSEALPLYKTGRALYKMGEGDTKGAVKQTVGAVDNIVLQPAKQALAATVAAKGALIGSAICPGAGTAIGAAVGYFGTLLGWGKARNAIVDSIMDE